MYINGKKILSVVKALAPTGIRKYSLTLEHGQVTTIDIKDLTLFRAKISQLNTTDTEDINQYTLYIEVYDEQDTLLLSIQDYLGDFKENACTISYFEEFLIIYSNKLKNVYSSMIGKPAYIEVSYEYHWTLENSSDNIAFSIEEL